MTIADWIMILAVLVAPVLAVQIQKHLEALRERRGRKVHLFQTLMATRGARLSPLHVQTLNMIDIEFYGTPTFGGQPRRNASEQAVLDAWKTYHDHLGEQVADNALADWARKRDDLFTELLCAIAKAVGYHYDKVHLRKGIYTPVGHGQLDDDQQIIRKSLVSILSGNKAVPIIVVSNPGLEHEQKDAHSTSAQFPASPQSAHR